MIGASGTDVVVIRNDVGDACSDQAIVQVIAFAARVLVSLIRVLGIQRIKSAGSLRAVFTDGIVTPVIFEHVGIAAAPAIEGVSPGSRHDGVITRAQLDRVCRRGAIHRHITTGLTQVHIGDTACQNNDITGSKTGTNTLRCGNARVLGEYHGMIHGTAGIKPGADRIFDRAAATAQQAGAGVINDLCNLDGMLVRTITVGGTGMGARRAAQGEQRQLIRGDINRLDRDGNISGSHFNRDRRRIVGQGIQLRLQVGGESIAVRLH